MTGKEFARKIFSPIVWINLGGMALVVVLICLATNWWLKSYTHHGEAVDVPDLKGKNIDEAMTQLAELDLEAVIVDSSYNKKLAPGIILDQTPGFGSRVKSGRQIYITINARNEPMLSIPNIIGNSSYREAEAKLQALGFKLGPCEYIPGDKDFVLGVKCRGRNMTNGQRVSVETPLTLVIGNSETEYDENGEIYIGDMDSDEDLFEEMEDNNTNEELVF
ncbi:MAG: PASTA domain-containing protein [Bacteroidales bacterium]|nr:PASTA domain-containing protein [Candidatus Physcousia equi]